MLVGSKNKRSRGELFGYTAKDIFVNCFPDGYAETEAIEDEAGEDGVGLGTADPNKKFHVVCKCDKVLYSSSKTKYTNPVSHVKKCIGEDVLAVSCLFVYYIYMHFHSDAVLHTYSYSYPIILILIHTQLYLIISLQ